MLRTESHYLIKKCVFYLAQKELTIDLKLKTAEICILIIDDEDIRGVISLEFLKRLKAFLNEYSLSTVIDFSAETSSDD